MRDYLYLWHDVEARCVVVSGLEFRDFLPLLKRGGGVILVDHQAEQSEFDARSSFEYVSAKNLGALARDGIESWGNFVWADYAGATMPVLGDPDVMQLLFVAHKGRPPDIAAILKATGGRFVSYGHDDGWYMALWYADASDVSGLLEAVVPPAWHRPDFAAFWSGATAYWLRAGELDREERTYDIDSVLDRRRWKRPVAPSRS